MALTVPLVPTGMKQGVRTAPRGVSQDARAGRSVAGLEPEGEVGKSVKPLASSASVSLAARVCRRDAVSLDEHRVPEAEETVAQSDRLCVGAPDALDPGESHGQRQHGAARQMEVGEQRVHRTETVPGRDEDIGRGADPSVRAHRGLDRQPRPETGARQGLEHPGGGGPDCHQPPPRAACLPQSVERLTGQTVGLAVDAVVLHHLLADGLECVEAHVQGHVG